MSMAAAGISFLDFLSGNVPGGIWILLFALAATWFVLWFLYAFSHLIRLGKILRIGSAISVFLIGLYALIWLKFPPPEQRTRVLVIAQPEFNGQPASEPFLAAYGLYHFLRLNLDPEKFLVNSPEIVLAVARWDSLADRDYLERILAFFGADYLVWAGRVAEMGGVRFSLADASNTDQKLLTGHRSVSQEDLASISRQIIGRLSGKELLAWNVPLEVGWQNEWDPWLIWAHGALERLRGRSPVAIAEFHRALRADTAVVPAWLGLAGIELDSARVLRRLGGYWEEHLARARGFLRRAAECDAGKTARYFLLAGETEILAENFVLAEQNLKRSHKLNPDDDRLYLDLARLHPSRYHDLGFLNERQLYRYALYLNPASVPGRIWYADWLNRNGDGAEAEQILQQFLEQFPLQLDVSIALGQLWIQRQQPEKAVELFNALLSAHREARPVVRYNLGVALYYAGQKEDARLQLKKAAASGKVPDAFLYLAKLAEEDGNLDEAIQYLRQRIRHAYGPEDPFKEEARKRLVILLARKEKMQQ